MKERYERDCVAEEEPDSHINVFFRAYVFVDLASPSPFSSLIHLFSFFSSLFLFFHSTHLIMRFLFTLLLLLTTSSSIIHHVVHATILVTVSHPLIFLLSCHTRIHSFFFLFLVLKHDFCGSPCSIWSQVI